MHQSKDKKLTSPFHKQSRDNKDKNKEKPILFTGGGMPVFGIGLLVFTYFYLFHIMSKVNDARRRGFTQIDNAFLQNTSISLEARGLLTIALSYPKDWNFTLKYLGTVTGKSRDTIGKYMTELIDKGYAFRIRKRINGKLSNYDYWISDFVEDIDYIKDQLNQQKHKEQEINKKQPMSEIPTMDTPPMRKIPTQGKPTQGKPTQENSASYKEDNYKEDLYKEDNNKKKKINKKDFLIFDLSKLNGKPLKAYTTLTEIGFTNDQALTIVTDPATLEHWHKWKYSKQRGVMAPDKVAYCWDNMNNQFRRNSFKKYLREHQEM